MVRLRMLLPVCAVAAGLAAAQSAVPRITYTRSFHASDPAFISVAVAQNGAAAFQAREHPADPLVTLDFTASPATVRALFAQAAELTDFSGPALQSKDKVAYTGDKSLAYDDAGQHHFQQFTYTKLTPATRMVDTFEKIAATGMSAIRLARDMRFDRLDVLDVMENIQTNWSLHALAEPQLLVPTLQQLARDSSQMQAARRRAEKLLAAIPPPPAAPAGSQ